MATQGKDCSQLEAKTKERAEYFEYEGVWFPPLTTPEILDKLKTFEVREDDLILSTGLKCGTHWMAEVLQLMRVDGHVDMIDRNHIGLLEMGMPPDMKVTTAELLAKKPSPRFYKTHLPARLLPPQVWTKRAKIVFVTRDPKDALTSFYKFSIGNPLAKPLTWDHVYNQFISGKALFGDWFDVTLEYWRHRNDENVFFVTYEEMKKDLRSVVTRLQKFLGVTVTPEGMERILGHASVEGMKKSYAKIEEEVENGRMYTRAHGVVPFIRKGVSGDWKTLFTDAQKVQMDHMVKEKLAGTGLEVHYH